MSMECTTSLPVSSFYSSNLNSIMDSYERVGQRICRSLGAPMINLEIHEDQLNEFISIAAEMFTKYAGYTREYLVFDSDLYEKDKGIRLDVLFSLSRSFNARLEIDNVNKDVQKAYTIGKMVIGDPNAPWIYQVGSRLKPDTLQLLNSYDYLIDNYRKVISVTDFEEGSTTGVNTLFTIEQTLAQQTYFSYAMGNYGFDLISWYVLKNWLETREKVLALRRDIQFDERTQYMRITPQPKMGSSPSRFYGAISCYVERPLSDIIKEPWVYQYATALTKIAIGNIRGKYTGTALFGGGQINASMLEQGINEKDKLEEKLFTGASAGFGDSEPILFRMG
jgi:hypothetical protein